jgi:hypothetical protein
VKSQPVEFLEFIEEDLRYARTYYDSWKPDGAQWFHERFRETVSWIEWNPEMFPKKYKVFSLAQPPVQLGAASPRLRVNGSMIRRSPIKKRESLTARAFPLSIPGMIPSAICSPTSAT